ncbi:MAG TPA: porin family protein [Saprospiraceae bacterium]|jgi:hypothetical protein|nr:MAG: hypothetical protein UZ08_BCD001002347 [Candidatus Parvibacillus calidus]MBX2937482.1 PorT family protein [Saprospiraceae bacterium]MBK7741977.1 PorT family protein [Candidatus Parvibacillus calidus]MBX7178027.1 PorT family protein [Saprospiraceae bacterium]MCB0590884.1 PorT family protein [Saprospiraceae bacterium]
MKLLKFLLSICFLFFFLSSYAQTTINPRIGLNISHLSGKPSIGENESRTGFNIGFNLRFGDRFQFETGAHYATHGVGFNDARGKDTLDRAPMHFVKLPLLANINIVNSEVFRLRVYGGWMNNFLLKVDNNSLLSKEDVNVYTGGIHFGTGLDLTGLTIDLSYEVGMMDFFKGNGLPLVLYPKNTQNNVLTLSVGVQVGGKR